MDIQVNAEFSDLLEYAGMEGTLGVLTEMETQGPRLLDLIDEGLKSGNMDAVAEAAHSLKSSCGALSLTRSADLAQRIETVARFDDGADLCGSATALKVTFRSELAAIRAFVEKKFKDGPAR